MVLGDEGRLAVERGGGCGEEVCPSVSLAPGRAGVVGVVEVVEARLDARRGGGGRHSLPARSAAPASAVPILLAVVHIVSVSSVAPLDAILVLGGWCLDGSRLRAKLSS